MAKILFWLTDRLPMRIINDGERPYLERYYLFTILGWRFYIHHFVGSDPERCLHDHPWKKAYSFILSGWYIEESRIGIKEVHWFNTLTGDTFHRVVLPQISVSEDGVVGQLLSLYDHGCAPCWTLFAHSTPDVKSWGFLHPLRHGIPNGEKIFRPYEYTREGSQKDWWKQAKSRKQLREGT